MKGPRPPVRHSPLPAVLLVGLVLAGCAVAAPIAVSSHEAEQGVTPSAPTPTIPLLTLEPPQEQPIIEPPSEDAADRFTGLRIEDLAERSYGGPGIRVGPALKYSPGFTRYAMTYESDGLTIGGRITIPTGDGPFPVIILNHGYLPPKVDEPGADTWRMGEWLAEHGYIAVASDYRNYGESSNGPNPFQIGYAVDVMNLIAQLDSLPQAISSQVGIIGHSMGGEVSMWPMVLSDEVDGVVLYASMSGDVARNWAYNLEKFPPQRPAMQALAILYGTPEQEPEAFAQLSPINYLDRVHMPVLIHHGMLDEVVPLNWSVELNDALHSAGVESTFYRYGDQGHTFRGDATFGLFMERNLAFFEEYVRGDVNRPGD